MTARAKKILELLSKSTDIKADLAVIIDDIAPKGKSFGKKSEKTQN